MTTQKHAAHDAGMVILAEKWAQDDAAEKDASERERILSALATFIRQRSGIEFGNYGDVAAYRQEQRSITKDLHDARELLAAVSWRTSIDAKALRESFRAFSGRLSWHAKGEKCETCKGFGKIEEGWQGPRTRECYSCKGSGVNATDSLDYCAGQYFPTEYRKAVCAVLASVLWGYFRANLAQSDSASEIGSLAKVNLGEAIRATAKRELSRGVATRWFN